MSQMPTAEEVTNLYLYGQTTKPTDMTSDQLIRASTRVTSVAIDINTYMAGPGRFASPSAFKVVEMFLNPSLFASSFNLAPGTYDKNQLFVAFGVNGIVKIDQSQYDDGKDDFLARAYIWNTTAFKIKDGAKFVIEANGNRYIDDFSVVPHSNDNDKENFDFAAGSTFGNIANSLLEPKVDPSKIGRKVDFAFTGNRTVSRFTYLDYVAATSTATTANPLLYATIVANSTAFLDRLWNSGSTRFLDEAGRAIFYGTNGQDTLSPDRFFAVPIDSNLRLAMDNKGVALVAGSGDDTLIGGVC